MELKPIDRDYYEYLFELLKERRPEINISHKKMPTWTRHVSFWESKPYEEAYIIYEDKPMGFIYLSDINEVGIFIEEKYHRQGIASKALELLLVKHKGERVLANVNPRNQNSIDFFTGLGFKHIQNTYELFS